MSIKKLMGKLKLNDDEILVTINNDMNYRFVASKDDPSEILGVINVYTTEKGFAHFIVKDMNTFSREPIKDVAELKVKSQVIRMKLYDPNNTFAQFVCRQLPWYNAIKQS